MIIKKVLVLGGTHGNERTGIALVKLLKDTFKSTYGFELDFAISNERASKENVRFIDEDLNRVFKNSHSSTYESIRAKELKEKINDETFVIDLHTTTSNMGETVILTHKDELTNKVVLRTKEQYPSVKIIKSAQYGHKSGYVNSISNHGLLVEMGPISTGLVRYNFLMLMKKVLFSILDSIEEINNGNDPHTKEVEHFQYTTAIPFPKDKNGEINSFVHPSVIGQDFQMIKEGDPLFIDQYGKDILHQGEEFYPVFVNEAAYYVVGNGVGVTKKVFGSL